MDDYFLMSREWKVIRMRALERDGAKCACCGATAATGAVMNVDHIKPRARFPELALSLENLQVLCGSCNHGKGNQFETDWRRPLKPLTPAFDPGEYRRRPPSMTREEFDRAFNSPEATDAGTPHP